MRTLLPQVLISTLAQSKVTSNIIERKVKEAAKTQEIIAKTRTGYVPIAFRASQLFFCIADLGTVDPMYQVLLWYIPPEARSRVGIDTVLVQLENRVVGTMM